MMVSPDPDSKTNAPDSWDELAAALLDPQRCHDPRNALAAALRHSNECGFDRGYAHALAARPSADAETLQRVRGAMDVMAYRAERADTGAEEAALDDALALLLAALRGDA